MMKAGWWNCGIYPAVVFSENDVGWKCINK
ncbi:hypothetical protein V6Z11_D11G354000 [Gossypium hirsutum]